MRVVAVGLLIVTWLRGESMAGPQATGSATHDPDVAITSPWIDQAPAIALATTRVEDGNNDHRLASGIGLASVYAGFAAWAYLAWYRDHPEKSDPQSVGDIWDCAIHPSILGCDGWYGKKTYAGGADKFGHAWATMTLARAGTAVLDAGGWNHTQAAIASALLAEGLFFAVEVKDYYYYEFSPGDFAHNTLGAAAAVALELSPRLDELIDFRVQYWPSKQYRNNLLDADSPCVKRQPGQPSCSRWNVAEDYSGETYLLAFHLGAIHSLRDSRYGMWSRFVDVSLGYESRNYKPPPTLDPDVVRRQHLFIGLSLNAQGLIDYALDRSSRWRKAGHGIFEVLTPPLTLPLVGGERTTTMPNSGGA